MIPLACHPRLQSFRFSFFSRHKMRSRRKGFFFFFHSLPTRTHNARTGERNRMPDNTYRLFSFATSTGHHSSFTIQVRPFAFFFFSILKNFVFNGRASAVFAAFTEGGGEVRYVSLLATFIYMNIRVQLSGRSFDQQQPKSINPRICPVLSFPLPIYERRCCCPCRPHTQAKLVCFFCRACIVVNFE